MIIPDISNIDENTTANVNLADIIKLNQIVDDYNQLRNVVLHNLLEIKEMSDNVKSEIEIDGVDHKLVSSWNDLIKSSNDSLKILTESYKNISNIILNIHKINSLEPKSKKVDDFQIDEISNIIKRIKNKEV